MQVLSLLELEKGNQKEYDCLLMAWELGSRCLNAYIKCDMVKAQQALTVFVKVGVYCIWVTSKQNFILHNQECCQTKIM